MLDPSSAYIVITFKLLHAHGIKVAVASSGLNPDLYVGVFRHYTLYSHVYRFTETSKLDLCRWPSLADGYLLPLRENRSLRARASAERLSDLT